MSEASDLLDIMRKYMRDFDGDLDAEDFVDKTASAAVQRLTELQAADELQQLTDEFLAWALRQNKIQAQAEEDMVKHIAKGGKLS